MEEKSLCTIYFHEKKVMEKKKKPQQTAARQAQHAQPDGQNALIWPGEIHLVLA